MISWPMMLGASDGGKKNSGPYTGHMIGYSYSLSPVTAGSAQTTAVPAGTATGDTLIAIIKHVGTLTLPDGWQMCLTDAQISAANPASYISVAKKKITSGDPASYTFTASATGRMNVDIVAFSGSLKYIDYSAISNVIENANPNVYYAPAISADYGDLIITAFHWYTFQTAFTNTQSLVIDGSVVGTWNFCSVSSYTNTATSDRFLMGAAYTITGAAGNYAANFRFYSNLISSIANGVGIVTVRFKAE